MMLCQTPLLLVLVFQTPLRQTLLLLVLYQTPLCQTPLLLVLCQTPLLTALLAHPQAAGWGQTARVVLLRCWVPLRSQPGSAAQQQHLAGMHGLLLPLWHLAVLLLLLLLVGLVV
jgi:hypothetical protein